jgi:hypothetical protein
MDLLALYEMIKSYFMDGKTLIFIFALLSLIQVSPLKINPWSWLLRMIRSGLGISELSESVKKLTDHMDEEDILNARRRILRFNDELLQDIRHSREMFDNVLDDITAYEHYCNQHKDFKNQKVTLAIENVNRVYKECMIEHSFL